MSGSLLAEVQAVGDLAVAVLLQGVQDTWAPFTRLTPKFLIPFSVRLDRKFVGPWYRLALMTRCRLPCCYGCRT